MQIVDNTNGKYESFQCNVVHGAGADSSTQAYVSIFGRVSNIDQSNINKNGVKTIVSGETVILYFDQNLDLNEQKQKISKHISDLSHKLKEIENKLKNKSFLKKAPKHIVINEKKALIDYKIELKKLNSVLNSIKN